ncbi:FAD:protein FMN transferase [Mongoliitalea daihaiensis]|uniref:FAD:protein FMN transferase n=1 Tax=Mongoliitalea daihaiensis TaxID=2782006 RepID=UPI001F41573C|nr:FAD:protein FMN transferase [Mongoliitalea daihaiensis]UJP66217.1 FAD:protein FMN transferase [Mongoliitalea daihaiensis]
MNNNAQKNIIYSIILLLLVVIVYLYRQNKEGSEDLVASTTDAVGRMVIVGQTMGTNYRVVYLDPEGRNLKSAVDSLLIVFNQSLSTYISDSEISRFNQSDSLVFELPFFLPVLQSSKEVFEMTEGAFDPTVGPVVNLWGFGPGGPQLKDSVNITSILPKIGFEKITFDQQQARKLVSGMYLDFSAIAKGYGVDVVADYLESKGIDNFLVEIGGELVARGLNDKGELWKVGINNPEEMGSPNDLYSVVALENKGMATSGNYRNYYEVDGLKISHTIDPKTGRPVRHGLLSATVLADDCMTADAIATAMMVMGTEKAIALQESLKSFEIFLIFNDESGELTSFASEGLKPYLSFIHE